MKLNLTASLKKGIAYTTFFLCLCAVAACQPTETADSEEAGAVAETVAADTVAKRPAPEFFVIPEDMVRKRVWICEDGVADLFHVQHDCPVLVECKGKGSFRNLLLPRAIEDFGRYNCQECSKELDVIFDKDAVREMGA